MDCTKQNMQLLTSNECGLEPAHAPASLTPDPLQETLSHPLQRIRIHHNQKKQVDGLGKDPETRGHS